LGQPSWFNLGDRMQRRDALALLAGASVAWPLAALAQQKAMPVIGFLGNGTASVTPWIAAFRRGLHGRGYVEGTNVAIEYRWAEARYDRLPALAADLVNRKVDVIVAAGTHGIQAAKSATLTIPIVSIGPGDELVAAGLIASVARPGGNLTGVSIMSFELDPKRLDLLSELVPQAKAIAFIENPTRANAGSMTENVQKAARAKGMQLVVAKAGTEAEIDAAFGNLGQLHVGVLLVGSDPFFNMRREQLVMLASRHAIPAMYQWREFAEAGGLVSYGSSLTDTYQQVGASVGRILAGAKPADLPIEQPTKFELVINVKTAKALGLTVPQSLLARADEVIE
jgi:putative tryptophan/tyrosine transport system substrate-binding protein